MNEKKEKTPDLVHQELFKRLNKDMKFFWIIITIQNLVIVWLSIRLFKVIYLLDLFAKRIDFIAQDTDSLTHCLDGILEIVKSLVSQF